ncbi:MAG: hypothetical protein KDD69_07885, partial [Bdellovibrionales bacterium]|nr:hypothetical protein [Bdellovibrionales bacterium]
LRVPLTAIPASARFGIGAACTWVGVMVAFFSLSAGKRRGYLLPVLPGFASGLAILLTSLFAELRVRGKVDAIFTTRLRTSGKVVWISTVSVAIIFCVFTFAQIVPFIDSCRDCQVSLYSFPIAVREGGYPLLLAALLFAAATAACWHAAFRYRSEALLGSAVFLYLQLIVVAGVNPLVAIKGVTHGYRDFAREVAERVPPGSQLYFMKPLKDESFDGFFFYYPTRVELVSLQQGPQKPGYYVTRKRWLADERYRPKEPVQVVHEGGRPIDTPDERLVLFHYGR